jgi:anti-sigma factor ChrR (cupin superfamily)
MTHDLTDEITNRAAMYALGALSAEDSLAFERHLAEACEVCAVELRAFEDVYAQLALTAPEAEPSIHVKDSLMRKIGQTKRPAPIAPAIQQASRAKTLTVFAGEGEWQELSEGVFVKELHKDERKGTVTSLFKMLPGAHASAHRHTGVEECLVLDGDFHVNDLILGPGDYHLAERGSIHENLYSEKGNLLLIISPQEGFQVLEAH